MGVAVVFPGQGSQSVGMADAWLTEPVAAAAIAEVGAAIGRELAAAGAKVVLAARSTEVPSESVQSLANEKGHCKFLSGGAPCTDNSLPP